MSDPNEEKKSIQNITRSKAESIDLAYSSEPWWYDVRGFLILTFAYRSTLPGHIQHFAANIGENHLEIAVGSGSLFDAILKWKKFRKSPIGKITAFDYADRMLNGARRRFAGMSNVTLIKADAAKLPWESLTFDTANAANCIHCFPEIEASLKEIHRVLKKDGTLAGNCLLYPKSKGPLDWIANRINQWGTRKGILNRPYQKDEIRALLQNAGFTLIQEKVTGNCYDFVAKS